MPNPTIEQRVFLKHFECFSRNGRWGTCADCPVDSRNRVYPEFCKYTKRNDHRLGIDSLAEQYKRRGSKTDYIIKTERGALNISAYTLESAKEIAEGQGYLVIGVGPYCTRYEDRPCPIHPQGCPDE